MKNNKKLILSLALVVVAAGSLTTWLITRANTSTQPVKGEYLQAFFARYVDALNSENANNLMAFYSQDSITVGPWGVEMNNAQRQAYQAGCREAFKEARFSVKNVTIKPTTETSGTITWEFGIKAGPQSAPFMGVWEKNSTASNGSQFDQEGISVGEVEIVDASALQAVKAIDAQIAALDNEIQQASSERKAILAQRREMLNQQKFNHVVSSIRFTRQTSYQNMDRFLKKINGE